MVDDRIRLDTLHGREKTTAAGNISDELSRAGTFERTRAARDADHLMTGADELGNEVTTDGPRGSGKKYAHGV